MNALSTCFEGLLDRHFESLLQDSPMTATYAGLKDGEGKLDRVAIEWQLRREQRRQKTLRELDRLSPRELSNQQHLDRLALRALLLREGEDFARRRHTLEPNGPELLLNLLLHELQRGEDESARAARNLSSLLQQAPRFLEESASLLDQPERVWLRVMGQTLAGADSLLQAVETFLHQFHSVRRDGPPAAASGKAASVSPTPQPSVPSPTLSFITGMVQGTRAALDAYGQSARGLVPAPEGSFAVGDTILQRRVRDELGLDYSLGQIEALALAEVERVESLLERACAPFGRRQPEDIIKAARGKWRPAKPLLELYRDETTRIAETFRAAKVVTFPDGECLDVKPVPDFMRALFPTAAYTSPGPFAPRQRGIFWVNDLSVLRTTKAERLAEQQQHFGLSLTCAHEAYPGHHLQFVTANRHPRRWRRLFAHAIFYEGWTLWCEQMAADLEVDPSPWLPVQQLHDALWRCHRILVDLRLQTGRYTYAQAVRHMQKHLGFTTARAEGDVNWYTAAPAVPMSYWLGRLENERLRQRLIEGRGWTLQRFNDWLLSFGTLPQAWIEKYGLD